LGYRHLFYCLPKSPVNESPSRFPNGVPMEKDAHLQSLLFICPTQSLVQEPSLRFTFQNFTRKVQPCSSALHPRKFCDYFEIFHQCFFHGFLYSLFVIIWRSSGLIWFGLFVHPFSHICNIGHVNYILQFTTQLIIYGHPHNTI